MEDSVLCKLSGTVLEYGVPTRSGKIYSKECIDIALDNDILKEQLNKSLHVLIEFPKSNEICLDTVCGVVKELKSDDDKLTASIVIFNNANGKIAKELIDGNNYDLGLLGYGSIEYNKVVSCNITGLTLTRKIRIN